jgi:hypothetical protein
VERGQGRGDWFQGFGGVAQELGFPNPLGFDNQTLFFCPF